MFKKMYKALVVDDDPIALQMVSFTLQKAGMSTKQAEDGHTAWSFFENHEFDLVVTDLHMPHRNGHSLVVELLEQPERPVIAVHTSVTDERLTKDLIRRGVDEIVYKPANYAAFATKMKALLELRAEAKGHVN